jgi:HEAT repeat protein
VEIYAKQESVDWSDSIERWMITVLDDPETSMRLDALSVLGSHSGAAERIRELCPALRQLARDVDPAVRGEAMLRVSACPRERTAELLMDGTRDPDPAVRLAVLKRLGWRFGGLEDTPADIALRRELANTLLRDTDPAVHAAAVQFTRQ